MADSISTKHHFFWGKSPDGGLFWISDYSNFNPLALDGLQRGGSSKELTADLSPGPRASSKRAIPTEVIKEVQPLAVQWLRPCGSWMVVGL